MIHFKYIINRTCLKSNKRILVREKKECNTYHINNNN